MLPTVDTRRLFGGRERVRGSQHEVPAADIAPFHVDEKFGFTADIGA